MRVTVFLSPSVFKTILHRRLPRRDEAKQDVVALDFWSEATHQEWRSGSLGFPAQLFICSISCHPHNGFMRLVLFSLLFWSQGTGSSEMSNNLSNLHGHQVELLGLAPGVLTIFITWQLVPVGMEKRSRRAWVSEDQGSQRLKQSQACFARCYLHR